MHKDFIVLGIHDGHNSSAAIVRNGQVVAAISEERLTRIKNEAGYPSKAIEACLKIVGCAPTEIDVVALGTKFMHHREFFLSWDWYRKGYDDQIRDSEGQKDRFQHLAKLRLSERK